MAAFDRQNAYEVAKIAEDVMHNLMRKYGMREVSKQPTSLSQLSTQVATAVSTSIVNKVLSILPAEARASLEMGTFVGGMAREVAEGIALAGGATAVQAGNMGAAAAKIGYAAGSIAGPAMVQAQRSLKRREDQRQALLASTGPFGNPETIFSGRFSLMQSQDEVKEKLYNLLSAVGKGDNDKVKDILRWMGDAGKAGMEATKAYLESLADWQGETRSKTVAEVAWNQRVGRIPAAAYQNYSVIYGRANVAFEAYRKDPPVKG